jgi:hypothetical protein
LRLLPLPRPLLLPQISDKGARALVKVLAEPSCVVTTLNLANNQVHADGARALARALRSSQSLTSLNLRLNRCAACRI